MKLDVFSLNKIGGRKNIEDTIFPPQYSPDSLPVFVVCDGVGGNRHGEVASALASQCFYQVFTKNYQETPKRFNALLLKALKDFQDELAKFIQENPFSANASTTLTIMVLHPQKAFIAWCGDSRIYHLRKGSRLYKTQDHSLVAQLVARGEITEEEALRHPQRNIITRCLHQHTSVEEIDTFVIENLQNDDCLLACTDGLLEQFTESVLLAFFADWDSQKDYAEVIDDLCIHKTKDNYSMYLAHISDTNAKIGLVQRLNKWFR